MLFYVWDLFSYKPNYFLNYVFLLFGYFQKLVYINYSVYNLALVVMAKLDVLKIFWKIMENYELMPTHFI